MGSSAQEGRGRTTQPLRVDVVLASATWPVIASGAGRGLQFDRHELVARRNRQLREDLAQVVIDGALAEEQLRRDFPVGGTACDEARDLDLLRRQLVDRARIPLARRLAAGAKLTARTLGPWRRPNALELGQRGSQRVASLPPPARTAQMLAEQQLGAGSVERAPALRRGRKRPPEVALPRGGPRQHRAAARDERQRPRGRV